MDWDNSVLDQVGLLLFGHTGEETGHGDGVGIGEAVIPDAHTTMGPLGQRLAQGVFGTFRADRNHHHLARPQSFDRLQGLFQRGIVPFVEQIFKIFARNTPLVGGEAEVIAQLADRS